MHCSGLLRSCCAGAGTVAAALPLLTSPLAPRLPTPPGGPPTVPAAAPRFLKGCRLDRNCAACCGPPAAGHAMKQQAVAHQAAGRTGTARRWTTPEQHLLAAFEARGGMHVGWGCTRPVNECARLDSSWGSRETFRERRALKMGALLEGACCAGGAVRVLPPPLLPPRFSALRPGSGGGGAAVWGAQHEAAAGSHPCAGHARKAAPDPWRSGSTSV